MPRGRSTRSGCTSEVPHDGHVPARSRSLRRAPFRISPSRPGTQDACIHLIVAIFAGGWEFGRSAAWRVTGGVGLITLLAVIAAVILAVSGRYPQRIFDLVMGLNRWCYRVLAYVALMRDEYPPFRLDTGGTDPGHLSPLPGGPPTPQPDPAGSRS
jgi:hypothetical protein